MSPFNRVGDPPDWIWMPITVSITVGLLVLAGSMGVVIITEWPRKGTIPPEPGMHCSVWVHPDGGPAVSAAPSASTGLSTPKDPDPVAFGGANNRPSKNMGDPPQNPSTSSGSLDRAGIDPGDRAPGDSEIRLDHCAFICREAVQEQCREEATRALEDYPPADDEPPQRPWKELRDALP